MEKVIDISKRDDIPTYKAADRMAEERIRAISEVRKYVDDLHP
jgi:leucine dehydrogenase